MVDVLLPYAQNNNSTLQHFAILHTWGDFDVNCLAVSPYEDMVRHA
jgi:hypothetical protein